MASWNENKSYFSLKSLAGKCKDANFALDMPHPNFLRHVLHEARHRHLCPGNRKPGRLATS